MKIKINSFFGEIPKSKHTYTYKANDNLIASKAVNCNLSLNSIKPFRDLLFLKKLKDDTKLVIYDENKLKEFDNKDVSYARITNAITFKVRTGYKKYPEVCYEENTEETWYRLGIPRPAEAPKVGSAPRLSLGTNSALELTGKTDSLDARSYVYCYVNSLGEEGAPSLPSKVATVTDGAAVSLSGIKRPPAGYDIKKIRVYRSSSGYGDDSNGTTANYTYRLVKEISANSATVSDNVKICDLGDDLNSMWVSSPPDDLRDVVAINNSIFAGVSGQNIIRFSSPNEVFNWGVKYEITLKDKILRIFALNNSLIVFTINGNYIITPNFNNDFFVKKYNEDYILLNPKYKNSIINYENGICYVTSSGIVYLTENSQNIITSNFFNREKWQELYPDTMILCQLNSILFISSIKRTYMVYVNSAEGFCTEIFNINKSENKVLKPDYIINTANSILFIFGNKVYQFDSDNKYKEYCWTSKRIMFDSDINFAACKILCGHQEGVSLLKILDDKKVLIYCYKVVDNHKFRLPARRISNGVFIEFTGTKEILELTLASSFKELQ